MKSTADTKTLALSGKLRMTPFEAFVVTPVAQGVKDTFGIVGSAHMDAHDLFPGTGIRFISVAHEQNPAHMVDGYSRITGRHGVCIAQNGPGMTNFVTAIANNYLHFEAAPSFLASMSFSNCSYTYLAAIGAKVGRPRPAIAYVGDATSDMSLAEVMTCVHEDIPKDDGGWCRNRIQGMDRCDQ